MRSESCPQFLSLTIDKLQKIVKDDGTVYKVKDLLNGGDYITVTDFTGIGLFITLIWSNELYNEFRINDTVVTNTSNGNSIGVESFIQTLCKKRLKKKMILSFEIRLTNPNYTGELKTFGDPYNPLFSQNSGTISNTNIDQYLGDKLVYVNIVNINPTKYLYFRILVSLDREEWKFKPYSLGPVHMNEIDYKNFDEAKFLKKREEMNNNFVFSVLNPNSGNYYPLKSSKGTKYILEGTKILKREDSEGFRDWDMLLKKVPYNKSCSTVRGQIHTFTNFIEGTYFSPRNPEWGEKTDITVYKDRFSIDGITGGMIMTPTKKMTMAQFVGTTKTRYAAVYIWWVYGEGRHASLLFFDKRDKIVYHIDPNGDIENENRIITRNLSKSNYTFKSVYDGFEYGPQVKQDKSHFRNFQGSCGAWSQYLLAMLMLNPSKNIEEIVSYIMDKSPNTMNSLIRRFTEFIYRTIGSPNIHKLNKIGTVDQKEWNRKMDTLKTPV